MTSKMAILTPSYVNSDNVIYVKSTRFARFYFCTHICGGQNGNKHTVLNSTKEGLGELKQLNLNANQIRSSKIEGSALRDARTLKKLEARGNKLSRVPSLSNTTESVDLSGE